MVVAFLSAFSISTFMAKSFAWYFGRFAGFAIAAACDSEARKHCALCTRKLHSKHTW